MPISTAEHGLWCPCQPILQGMEGCTAFPAPPVLLSAENSPFPQPFLPIHQERQLCSEASCCPPRVPGLLPGVQDSSMTSLGERLSLVGNGEPQHAQAGALGWGLSPWASTAQAFSLLHLDLFVPRSILTAETGGAGQPSSAMAQQMGPWPLTCCPAWGPWSWLLSSASCGATPAQGTHSARHGVSLPLVNPRCGWSIP